MNEMQPFLRQDKLHDVEERSSVGIKKIPSVAVVILNWNGKTFLEKFLPFLMAVTYTNKRIIVADNASGDDSVQFLQQHYPQVEIVMNASNEGFAKGYNTALKQIDTDYYVLLNSDVEVTPGFIEPIVELMEANRQIGACQPKVLSYNERNLFEYAGACGGWIDNMGYPFSRGRIFDVLEEDNGQYDDAVPCFWASGAALFIQAKLYHQSGGLDEHFFAHQEEIDLCWRLQLMSYKIYVQPASVVYHVGGGTLPKGNSRKVFLNFRNNLVMLAKNSPLHVSLWRIPCRIVLDAVAAWQALLKGDAGFFFAVIKAHWYFAQWVFTGKKQEIVPVKKDGLLKGVYKGSVVWQHFIQKKNKFSEIVAGK